MTALFLVSATGELRPFGLDFVSHVVKTKEILFSTRVGANQAED